VSNEQYLKSLFDRYSSLEVSIVHQILNEIEEFAWLKARFVGDTPLIHDLEFIFADVTVEVIIDFPDVKCHFRSQQFQTEVCEHFHKVIWSNLIIIDLVLFRILADEIIEHSVQLLLLNSLDLVVLQLFPGGELDFVGIGCCPELALDWLLFLNINHL